MYGFRMKQKRLDKELLVEIFIVSDYIMEIDLSKKNSELQNASGIFYNVFIFIRSIYYVSF